MVGPAHRRAPATAFADTATATGSGTPGLPRSGWIGVPARRGLDDAVRLQGLTHAYQD